MDPLDAIDIDAYLKGVIKEAGISESEEVSAPDSGPGEVASVATEENGIPEEMLIDDANLDLAHGWVVFAMHGENLHPDQITRGSGVNAGSNLLYQSSDITGGLLAVKFDSARQCRDRRTFLEYHDPAGSGTS